MIHAFKRMRVPGHVLTDNMKSVVLHRDSEGHPVWNHDYEAFMNTIGFETKLCRPRHPFTKGSVERLVRFVKENFLLVLLQISTMKHGNGAIIRTIDITKLLTVFLMKDIL